MTSHLCLISDKTHDMVPGGIEMDRSAGTGTDSCRKRDGRSQLKLSLTAAMHNPIYSHEGALRKLLTYMYEFIAGSNRVPTMTMILTYYCCCLSRSYSLLLLLTDNTNHIMYSECALYCQKGPDKKMSWPWPCQGMSLLTGCGFKAVHFHSITQIELCVCYHS